MIVEGINLSRWIILFLAAGYQCANAQTGNESPENQYGLYSNFDPSLAIIVVVLVFAFFFVGFFTIYIRQCSDTASISGIRLPAAFSGSTRGCGLDQAVIESFPVFVYSAVKDIKIGRGALECAVCLNEFQDDDNLRLLPKCDHVFHPECIDAWLVSHSTCPVCRAKLTPESGQEVRQPIAPQLAELSRGGLNHDIPTVEFNEASNHSNQVVINVNEEQNRESQINEIGDTMSQGMIPKRNRPPRSGISGRFPRSHSTGHSLVQSGENNDRYTLRLPSEFRRQLMASAKLKRAVSFNAIWAPEGSSRKGYRGNGGEGSSRGKSNTERWVFSMNPPFVSRGGSFKSPKIGGEGDGANGKTFFNSVKGPLNCMSLKVEKDEESPA